MADAYAEWNVEAQRWEVANTFDKGAFCNRCDGETTLDWVPVDTPEPDDDDETETEGEVP
ncbi:MAG: hypothetical protein GC190_21825 [Alphaproteobacteria bacterium]|nr:hypothetical protein [Alphaproteobacteria bacterium]